MPLPDESAQVTLAAGSKASLPWVMPTMGDASYPLHKAQGSASLVQSSLQLVSLNPSRVALLSNASFLYLELWPRQPTGMREGRPGRDSMVLTSP